MSRVVEIDPTRLCRWLETFTTRHGPVTTRLEPLDSPNAAGSRLVVEAADGARARITAPFAPPAGGDLASFVDAVAVPRTVAALLVRRGGVAVGVFHGRDLVVSKIETAYVQGRTKAGGWSQQRYARRRVNQARQLIETAAELVVTIVLPRRDALDLLATGGDRASVEEVLTDPRLGPLRDLRLDRVHPVPDPRLPVLRRFPDQYLALQIELNDLA
ncbi:MAG TPA: acVLRF1 family peptidyl-tRNA hydrolase [Microlunatus sp.]|nr:acVLRF1 family peptidyl-tRNA hydrolase [Microlunatus sp.]